MSSASRGTIFSFLGPAPEYGWKNPMNTFHRAVCALALVAVLGSSLPALANDDGDSLKKAEDLVKQAWNPGGDPPGNRVDLLTQALGSIKDEPDHHLRGMRVQAAKLIRQAIDDINAGDPDHKVYGELKDADSKLRSAIETAEGH